MDNVVEFYKVTEEIDKAFSEIKTDNIVDVIPGLLDIKYYTNGKIKIGKYKPKTSVNTLNICINKSYNKPASVYTLSYRNNKTCVYIAQDINLRRLCISAYCQLVKTKIISNKFKIKNL